MGSWWGWLVAGLVVVVAILQIVHLFLLDQLSKLPKPRMQPFSRGHPDTWPQHWNDEARMVAKLGGSNVLDAAGEYRIVRNVAGRFHTPDSHDVTLVTQTSVQNLHYLVELAKTWQGMISVSVFSVESDITLLARILSSLRKCHPEISANVTFHVVLPLPPARSDGDPPVSSSDLPSLQSCGEIQQEMVSLKYEGNYKFRALMYPNNLLRNVARRAAATEFVLVTDIDMIPSPNLKEHFVDFAIKSNLFGERNDKTVYVIPAYEAKETLTPPKTKAQLLQKIQDTEVRPFYMELCWNCQKYTDYGSWQRASGDGLVPLFEVLWRDPWEPFYISRNSVPFYDERFRQYGFNRISQVCELHIAGYKFSVLNNGWLLHRGLKLADSFHPSKGTELERNRGLFRVFKQELKDKYPESSRRCY